VSEDDLLLQVARNPSKFSSACIDSRYIATLYIHS
jgi:hypothetical protein